MIVIGTAEGYTHYIDSTSHVKGCGGKNALCGTEVYPADYQPEETAVTCFYCRHAYDIGVHLVKKTDKS